MEPPNAAGPNAPGSRPIAPDLQLLREQTQRLGFSEAETEELLALARVAAGSKRDDADKTEETCETEEARLDQARDGAPILAWRGKQLHSRHAPHREAERQAAEWMQRLENDRQMLICFGAGLGYAIRVFLEARPNPVLWLEPNAAIAALALATQDLRFALPKRDGKATQPRLKLILGVPEDGALHGIFAGRGNGDTVFALHRGSLQADAVYANLRSRIESFLNKKAVNLATMARFDRLWAKNLLRNFRPFARARPLARLYGSAAERSAIVFSAGPSLYYDIQKLIQRGDPRERFVLIAVDTALGTLAHFGLQPHFVVSVDAQAVNRYYFELPREFLAEAWIALDPTSCYMSLRLLEAERCFYFASPFPLAKIFQDRLNEDAGELASGGSVSTNAYDLAVRLGCRRILLAGQDLAFTEGLAHSRGAVLEERLNFREERLFRRELHNYRQLSALPVRWLPGEDGSRVPANDKLAIFHGWLEARFARDAAEGIVVRNLSRGGARLEHAARITEAEFREEWERAGTTAPAPYDAPREAPGAPPALDMAGLQSDLEGLARDFRAFAELLEEGVSLAEKLQAAAKRPDQAEFSRLLREMEAMDARVLEDSGLSRLAGGSMQRVIFRITENFEASSASEGDAALAAAEKTLALYAGLEEAARLHARWFARSAREFQYAAAQDSSPRS